MGPSTSGDTDSTNGDVDSGRCPFNSHAHQPSIPGLGFRPRSDAPAPTPTPLSPISLSTREFTFCVQVPDTTPPDEQVYLLVMPFLDWSWTQHVPLTNEGNGVWSGTASVEEGALVRYVYDR